MGDVGSAPLGYFLAILVVWASIEHGWALFIPLALLHANFVLDTAITLIRRILRKEKWYDAHREHFYQRLVRAGKSHTYVTCLEMGLQLVVLALMIWYLRHESVPLRIAIIVAVIAIWVGFFCYAELILRKISTKSQAPNFKQIPITEKGK